jgi:hypothetical protein
VVANTKTREIADQAAAEGVTPLEVQLRTMREYWRQAHATGAMDHVLADKACAIAAQCAPFLHPRLASVAAKIDVDVGVQLTAEQRRERARKAILGAFAERTPAVQYQPIGPVLRVVSDADEVELLADETVPEPS